MIEIAISSELAAEHRAFVAGCVERWQHVEVFSDRRVERAGLEEVGRSGSDLCDDHGGTRYSSSTRGSEQCGGSGSRRTDASQSSNVG
jgi:hypothetical protein